MKMVALRHVLHMAMIEYYERLPSVKYYKLFECRVAKAQMSGGLLQLVQIDWSMAAMPSKVGAWSCCNNTSHCTAKECALPCVVGKDHQQPMRVCTRWLCKVIRR